MYDEPIIGRQESIAILPYCRPDYEVPHPFLKKDRDRRFLDRSRFASSSSSGATTLIFDRRCVVLIRVVSTVIDDFDN